MPWDRRPGPRSDGKRKLAGPPDLGDQETFASTVRADHLVVDAFDWSIKQRRARRDGVVLADRWTHLNSLVLHRSDRGGPGALVLPGR
jgi:hypothetical protein